MGLFENHPAGSCLQRGADKHANDAVGRPVLLEIIVIFLKKKATDSGSVVYLSKRVLHQKWRILP